MDKQLIKKAAILALASYDPREINGVYSHENIQYRITRDNDNTLWIAFRGTDESADWMDNLDARKTHVRFFGDVHAGFYHAMESVWPHLLMELQHIENVIFVGHSLGGAIAAMSANHAYQTMPIGLKIQLITFGQPRCGDADWASAMNFFLGDDYVRVFNAGDPVPHVPSAARFHHAGREIYFDANGQVAAPTLMTRIANAGKAIVSHGITHSMATYQENVSKL